MHIKQTEGEDVENPVNCRPNISQEDTELSEGRYPHHTANLYFKTLLGVFFAFSLFRSYSRQRTTKGVIV